MTADRTRAHDLIDALCGKPDAAADRTVEVLNAQAAALSWVREATGAYPAPASVAEALNSAAGPLRTGDDPRDPVIVLGRIAVEALAAHRQADTAG